jgi:hypothetical protein
MERPGSLRELGRDLRDWRVALCSGVLVAAIAVNGAYGGQLLTGRDPCTPNDTIGSYVSVPLCDGYRHATRFLRDV